MDQHIPQDDNTLLSAIRMADRQAYACLFRKYYPILCAYGSRFVSLEDAEEIAQDIMLWLWESREMQQFDTSLSHYLFKAVYRRALNKIESNQSQQRINTVFFEQIHEMLQDVDVYQIEELRKQIKEAINNLQESYREAFMMHRFGEMSYKEIAASLGISHKTVDYRIQQALKQLRIDLKEYLPAILPFLLVQAN